MLFGNKDFIRKKKYKEIDFKLLASTNKYYKESEAHIDEVTWQDLDMDNVFADINHTVTTPGEEKLYCWLRNPADNKQDFNKRKNHINSFKKDRAVSNNLRLALSRIKYCDFDFRETINKGFLINNLLLIGMILLVILNVGILAVSLITMNFTALPLFIITMAASIIIHFRFSMTYNAQLQVIGYIIKILSFSKKNWKSVEKVSPDLADRLKELNSKLSKITKKGSAIFKVEGLDVIGDYINILFLIKEINFLRVSSLINKNKKDLIRLYNNVGDLDAGLSIDRYRRDLKYYCEPDMDSEFDDINIIDMYHPLLENPISNTIDIGSSIAITGSNMSGKSTFLRTVGLNSLFAQGICTSLSKEHRAKFYKLVTSISLNDDILQGKSYFLMEAEAIKRMVDSCNDETPLLILIDEIFKGTNPVERLAASMEILNLLAAANTKTLVATHDLQILPELKGYEYYYFTENVTKDSLEFDYKVHKGITSTRNAIKILEFIKYPGDLVDLINKRIEVMEL
ncbi:MutS-related protein [Vallitalea guaymasensis]|uniref:MutS-related protein n=1 Tax=Vallitalea guaymasensis TaxID=1185412 RepID=UPI00235262A4|nr:hypothetical protein [Vallitalea guaymasensis]